MDALIGAIANTGNVAILCLVLVIIALFAIVREQAKDASEDRRATRDTLLQLAEVITQLRIDLARRAER